MLLHGIFPPITTPFYPDGKVYSKKLEANVERYSKAPVAGLVVLGSTGEAILLSGEEQREVLRVAREAAAAEKVLIAGTGAESAIETLRLTEYAASLGYDVAMVRTPHYYKAQMKPENMLAFYRTVADRAPIPVIIYNFPPSTGYDIPAEVVIALAEHPNLIGIKESGGDINKVKKMVTETRHIHRTVAVTEVFEAVTGRMKAAPPAENVVPATALSRAPAAVAAPPVKTRTKDAGFQVMVGSAHLLQSMLNVGAVGAILAFADCAPTACFEIYSAWKDNDVDLAREKQERIKQAAIRVVGELGVPGLKYALDFNGYYGGPPRLPLLTASAEVRAEIERLMEYIRN